MNGKDLGYHPEDDPKTTKMSIAPPPSAEEFLINKTNEEVCVEKFNGIIDGIILIRGRYFHF